MSTRAGGAHDPEPTANRTWLPTVATGGLVGWEGIEGTKPPDRWAVDHWPVALSYMSTVADAGPLAPMPRPVSPPANRTWLPTVATRMSPRASARVALDHCPAALS